MTVPRKPVTPIVRGLARGFPYSPGIRLNGLMPRSATRPRPALGNLERVLSAARPAAPILRGLAPALAATQPAVRLAEALAPVDRVSKALAPATRLGEVLAPVNRVSTALTPVTRLGEALAPLHTQPRLGPPLPSLFDQRSCGRQQEETRLVSVSGTREDWATFDDGQTVGLTKC